MHGMHCIRKLTDAELSRGLLQKNPVPQTTQTLTITSNFKAHLQSVIRLSGR